MTCGQFAIALCLDIVGIISPLDSQDSGVLEISEHYTHPLCVLVCFRGNLNASRPHSSFRLLVGRHLLSRLSSETSLAVPVSVLWHDSAGQSSRSLFKGRWYFRQWLAIRSVRLFVLLHWSTLVNSDNQGARFHRTLSTSHSPTLLSIWLILFQQQLQEVKTESERRCRFGE